MAKNSQINTDGISKEIEMEINNYKSAIEDNPEQQTQFIKKLNELFLNGYDKFYLNKVVLKRPGRTNDIVCSNSSFDIFYLPLDFKALTELPFYTNVAFENKIPYFGTIDELSSYQKSYEVFMFGLNEVEVTNEFSNKIRQNSLKHVIINDLIHKINSASFVETIMGKIYMPNIVEISDNAFINCNKLAYVQMPKLNDGFNKDTMIYGIKHQDLKFNFADFNDKFPDDFNLDLYLFRLRMLELMFMSNKISIYSRTKITEKELNVYNTIINSNDNKNIVNVFKNNNKIIAVALNKLIRYTTITSQLSETDILIKLPPYMVKELETNINSNVMVKQTNENTQQKVVGKNNEYFKQLQSLKKTVVKQNEEIDSLKSQIKEMQKRLKAVISVMYKDFNKGESILRELNLIDLQ